MANIKLKNLVISAGYEIYIHSKTEIRKFRTDWQWKYNFHDNRQYQQRSNCENTEGEGIFLQTEKSVAIQVITKRH